MQKEADGVPPWCGCGQGRALSLCRCVAGVSEGACKSAWLPRVELRRRLVREKHAARTAIGTAMQHPQIAKASATARTNVSCARPAVQGLPSQTRRCDAQGAGWYVGQSLTHGLGRHALLQVYLRAGVLSRVVSSASSPRRRALQCRARCPSLFHLRSFAVDEFATTHFGESEPASTREAPDASE